MKNVLLIDDDCDLTAMLANFLSSEGFKVKAVHTGEEGEAEIFTGHYDIVVLDIMLPTITGIEILRRVRARSDIPVLLLTARGDNVDRIAGLDLGADDYVPKPSSPGELVARLRAILRRTGRDQNTGTDRAAIKAGRLTVWPARRKIEWQGQPLNLTNTEFNLLEELASQAGRLVSKDDLSSNALGRPLTRFDRRIDVHISSIRQKLGQRDDGDSWIQTVRGQGYVLVTE
ncbi:response regulator transcription factor [Marinobacter mangrovi]|uniref:response regulator transcription factor n=1 Tax=Marinobacter mangrovi TaxID=2803918 RepID=UPI0019340454|nr:response regulator transcription factor [Marinobacter mangrovi]